MRAVDFSRVIRPDISCRYGEKTGGLYFPGMRNKHNALAVPGGNGAAGGFASLSTGFLKRHAAIMVPFRRFDAERNLMAYPAGHFPGSGAQRPAGSYF